MKARARRRWLVAALLVVLGGLALVIGAPRGLGWWITRRAGMVVEIGGLGLAWRPFRLVADDARVRLVPTAAPVARADRVSVELTPLLRGERRLAVVGARLQGRRAPDGRVILPGAAGAPPIALHLDAVRVTGGQVVIAVDVGAERYRVPDATFVDPALRSEPARGTLDLRTRLDLGAGRAHLRVRQRSRRATQQLRIALATAGLEGAAVRALLPHGPLRAHHLRGRVRYARDAGAGPPLARLTGDGTVRALRLGRAAGPRVVLREVRLDGVTADLLGRTVRAERVTGRGGLVAGAQWQAIAASRWRAEVGHLTLGNVAVRGAGPALSLRALSAHDLSTHAESGTILADARLAAGGRVKLRGTIDPARPAARARVRLDGVAVAGLAPEVRLASGRLAGTGTASTPPWTLTDGRLALEDVRVLGEGAGDDTVLAWTRLALDVERLDLAPLRLWLRRATLEAPSLSLRRDAAGVHPLPVLTRFLASPALRAVLATAPEGTPADALPASPAALDVAVHGGRVRFEDRLVNPAFVATLGGIEASLHEDAGPRPRATDFTAMGQVDGGGAFQVAGRADGPSLRLRPALTALPLLALNSYLGGVGVLVRGGIADVTSDVDLRARSLEVPTRVAVAQLALDSTEAPDPFPALVGLPLARIVPLMADGTGRVVLDLPLAGDPRAPAFGLISALGTALRTAMADAITNPLLAEATLARAGGRETMRLRPLAFPADAATLPSEEPGMLDRVAVLLHHHPSLVATLRGRSGPPDAAARRGKARGATPEARALAQARAAHVRDRLSTGLGVPAARVRVAGEPAPPGPPAVLVEVSG